MILSYNELCSEIVDKGVLSPVDYKDVNGTSIDVHLGDVIKAERRVMEHDINGGIVSLRDKQRLDMDDYYITGGFYDLRPGEFILAHTVEEFNLPADISIEFKLNSSGARIGLENALATWGDPHWNGAVLTLELTNLTRYHTIRLHHGCRIGQIIFHRSEPVPVEKGYGVRGRYNGDKSVQEVKNV